MFKSNELSYLYQTISENDRLIEEIKKIMVFIPNKIKYLDEYLKNGNVTNFDAFCLYYNLDTALTELVDIDSNNLKLYKDKLNEIFNEFLKNLNNTVSGYNISL